MGKLTFLLLLLLLPSVCFGYKLSKEDVDCVCRETMLEAELNPHYVWGAAGTEPGAEGDCSGKLFGIFRRCGIPVLRTTANRMLSENGSGWDGILIPFEKGKRSTLVGMTMQPQRPLGHIGMLVQDVKYGTYGLMFHMSSSQGGVLVVLDKDENSYFYRHAVRYKDMTK